MKKIVFGLTVALLASQATATIINLDYQGTFTNTFNGIPLVAIGTSFSGKLTFDTDAAPTLVETYDKRYAFAGPATLDIGASHYSGPITALASKGPFGPDDAGFFQDLGGGVLFALRFNNLPTGSIVDLRLPENLAILSGSFLAGISTAQMQGNFGTVFVVASVAPPASTVPDMATWALMSAGLVLAGSIVRRRRAAIRYNI